MELQDVDGVPIAWRELGEGETVLFLHGLGMTRTGWDAVMQPLAQDYRCVAWDMPGYGASSPLEDFSLEAAADAAASLIAECGGTAHVVGLSMGGMVDVVGIRPRYEGPLLARRRVHGFKALARARADPLAVNGHLTVEHLFFCIQTRPDPEKSCE